MGLKEKNETCIFETEASWSDADKSLLCIPTGGWRTERPVVDKKKCNACGLCFVYCPPQCMKDDEDGVHFKPDLEYCKGCGVCAKECPKRAITMSPEGNYTDDCPAD